VNSGDRSLAYETRLRCSWSKLRGLQEKMIGRFQLSRTNHHLANDRYLAVSRAMKRLVSARGCCIVAGCGRVGLDGRWVGQ
jgi:hypothetical protein